MTNRCNRGFCDWISRLGTYCCRPSPEESVPLSVEETQPDSRTRPSGGWPLTTSYPSRQGPCNPSVGFNISEENVHLPVQETQPDIRTRSQAERLIPTSPVYFQDPGNPMEVPHYSVEELDTSMINLNEHWNLWDACNRNPSNEWPFTSVHLCPLLYTGAMCTSNGDIPQCCEGLNQSIGRAMYIPWWPVAYMGSAPFALCHLQILIFGCHQDILLHGPQ